MKRLLLIASLGLAGCAGNEDFALRPLPPAAEPSTEVTVIRPRATVQAEWPFYVVVANQPVFDLRNGEHTRFRISSGRQTLAIRCGGGLASAPADARVEQDFPPRGAAYFIVEPKNECASIRAIDARAAGADLATTRYRAVGTVNALAQATGDAPASFSSAPAPLAAAGTPQARVAAVTASWAEAVSSRDTARIASLYDTEAVLRDASGQRIATGPAAIADYFKGAKVPPGASIGEQEIRVFGDTAIDSGTYASGRYSIVYRDRGGKWLIVDHNLTLAR